MRKQARGGEVPCLRLHSSGLCEAQSRAMCSLVGSGAFPRSDLDTFTSVPIVGQVL